MVSGVAPPPQSKKFAGSPPFNLMTSIVAIAKPAPLTKHPMLPFNLTKFKSYFFALTSSGSSCDKSLQEYIFSCLNDALSSNPNLASVHMILWVGSCSISLKGLISTCVASLSMNILYKLETAFAASSCASGLKPRLLATSLAICGLNPFEVSIENFFIASGVLSATSSIFIPP
ncbi:hypothetical protein AWRI1631_74630 [Saccharomyces cerevisiae AWRI1631]|uniref:Uncharacterized protein n=1 Tax=Saccharomyces cerevisiae (strain AWRI1631) TaxID=545124 RepID=B5VJI3_YEAS6|nr:hypothetical protein AWRI1631_74630 [Saccharomyces cerevisiae AWRI1631]